MPRHPAACNSPNVGVNGTVARRPTGCRSGPKYRHRKLVRLVCFRIVEAQLQDERDGEVGRKSADSEDIDASPGHVQQTTLLLDLGVPGQEGGLDLHEA